MAQGTKTPILNQPVYGKYGEKMGNDEWLMINDDGGWNGNFSRKNDRFRNRDFDFATILMIISLVSCNVQVILSHVLEFRAK